ncbi:VanZ family protein [Anaerobacillus alkaliphilus]|uniref:VanZ family protein n=1 Tax=Anaerobacillus alkaliphilus TaxID=1548597 RepID=A0A4Q0VNV5_9BACI|nr:VanZ family protein [Anaerobacillus alkaliphilus]RXI96532.1 VanZ family protein [Anaerobacillus alkaliphilus]
MSRPLTIVLLLSQLVFFLLMPIWFELTSYLHPIVIVVVWFCFTSFIFFAVCWLTDEKILISPVILHAVIYLYLGSLLVLLFFRPANQTYGTISLLPFETILYYLFGEVSFLVSFYNLAANIGLFIPFGVYYRYITMKASFPILLGFAIVAICLIEGLQFITKRGSLDIDDLILNVGGICLGYWLQPIVKKIVLVSKKE